MQLYGFAGTPATSIPYWINVIPGEKESGMKYTCTRRVTHPFSVPVICFRPGGKSNSAYELCMHRHSLKKNNQEESTPFTRFCDLSLSGGPLWLPNPGAGRKRRRKRWLGRLLVFLRFTWFYFERRWLCSYH